MPSRFSPPSQALRTRRHNSVHTPDPQLMKTAISQYAILNCNPSLPVLPLHKLQPFPNSLTLTHPAYDFKIHRGVNDTIALLWCYAAYIASLTTDVSVQPIGPIFKGEAVSNTEGRPAGCPETSVTTNVTSCKSEDLRPSWCGSHGRWSQEGDAGSGIEQGQCLSMLTM